MSMVSFIKCTSEQYNQIYENSIAVTQNPAYPNFLPDALYFLEDTGKLLKNNVNYSNSLEFLDSDPRTASSTVVGTPGKVYGLVNGGGSNSSGTIELFIYTLITEEVNNEQVQVGRWLVLDSGSIIIHYTVNNAAGYSGNTCDYNNAQIRQLAVDGRVVFAQLNLLGEILMFPILVTSVGIIGSFVMPTMNDTHDKIYSSRLEVFSFLHDNEDKIYFYLNVSTTNTTIRFEKSGTNWISDQTSDPQDPTKVNDLLITSIERGVKSFETAYPVLELVEGSGASASLTNYNRKILYYTGRSVESGTDFDIYCFCGNFYDKNANAWKTAVMQIKGNSQNLNISYSENIIGSGGSALTGVFEYNPSSNMWECTGANYAEILNAINNNSQLNFSVVDPFTGVTGRLYYYKNYIDSNSNIGYIIFKTIASQNNDITFITVSINSQNGVVVDGYFDDAGFKYSYVIDITQDTASKIYSIAQKDIPMFVKVNGYYAPVTHVQYDNGSGIYTLELMTTSTPGRIEVNKYTVNNGNSLFSSATTYIFGSQIATTATLNFSAAPVSNNSREVNINIQGVENSNPIVIASPAPTSNNTWSSDAIYCTAQTVANGTLTLTFESKGNTNVDVNILVIN